MNPRVILWLKAYRLDVTAIDRQAGDDLPLVTDTDGKKYPWTVVFSLWVIRRWHAWGEFHGYLDYRDAQLGLGVANAHADFDSWLESNLTA